MGRPQKNLEPYKESLIDLFQKGATYEDLKTWLEVEHQLQIAYEGLKPGSKIGVLEDTSVQR